MNRSPPFAVARVFVSAVRRVVRIFVRSVRRLLPPLSLSLSPLPLSPLCRFVDDHTRRVFSPLNARSRVLFLFLPLFLFFLLLVSISFQRVREIEILQSFVKYFVDFR